MIAGSSALRSGVHGTGSPTQEGNTMYIGLGTIVIIIILLIIIL